MYRGEDEQCPRRLEKVTWVPWDREKRRRECCCASSHMCLSIAISIYTVISTLDCSNHLGIKGERIDRCNTGKFDCNIQEKSKKKSPNALTALQHHHGYLPSNMFSLYNNVVQSGRVNSMMERKHIKKNTSKAMKERLAITCLLCAYGYGRWRTTTGRVACKD